MLSYETERCNDIMLFFFVIKCEKMGLALHIDLTPKMYEIRSHMQRIESSTMPACTWKILCFLSVE